MKKNLFLLGLIGVLALPLMAAQAAGCVALHDINYSGLSIAPGSNLSAYPNYAVTTLQEDAGGNRGEYFINLPNYKPGDYGISWPIVFAGPTVFTSGVNINPTQFGPFSGPTCTVTLGQSGQPGVTAVYSLIVSGTLHAPGGSVAPYIDNISCQAVQLHVAYPPECPASENKHTTAIKLQ